MSLSHVREVVRARKLAEEVSEKDTRMGFLPSTPQPGNFTDQRMFSVWLQRVRRLWPSAIPSPFGPLQCGQSEEGVLAAEPNALSAARIQACACFRSISIRRRNQTETARLL